MHISCFLKSSELETYIFNFCCAQKGSMNLMSLLTCRVGRRTKAEGGARSCGTCCGCPKATKCSCRGGGNTRL